jgi:hypothetical protein
MTPLVPRRHFSQLLFVGGAASLAAACAGADDGAPVSAKALGLSNWVGTDKELFDDQIDPAALGFMPGKAARRDETLWARAQASEITGRVRIQTVTVDSRGGDARYHLGLRFANQLLAPTSLEDRDFEVTIDTRDPAYGVAKALDTGLQGRTFVGFLKRFAGADDQVEVHFFLAADSAEVAAAVQEAVAIKEVRKR